MFRPNCFLYPPVEKIVSSYIARYNVNDSISNFDFVITPRNLPNPGRGVTAVQRKYM